MKPPARRLGRGLGAFLDFGPAGEDGTAFVADALEARSASVLETSAPQTTRSEPRPSPVVAIPRPAAVAPAATIPAPPPSDDRAFVDDVVEGLSFPEVDLE